MEGDPPLKPGTGSILPERADDQPAGSANAGDLPSAVIGSVSGRAGTVFGPLPAAPVGGETRDLNAAVHPILVVGLGISTALLLVGIALELLSGGSLPTVTLAPGVALAAALHVRPSGFISLGLLVLMATPILRVMGSVLVFMVERDWLYMGVTLFVLAVMVVSIIVGRG